MIDFSLDLQVLRFTPGASQARRVFCCGPEIRRRHLLRRRRQLELTCSTKSFCSSLRLSDEPTQESSSPVQTSTPHQGTSDVGQASTAARRARRLMLYEIRRARPRGEREGLSNNLLRRLRTWSDLVPRSTPPAASGERPGKAPSGCARPRDALYPLRLPRLLDVITTQCVRRIAKVMEGDESEWLRVSDRAARSTLLPNGQRAAPRAFSHLNGL